MYIGQACTHLLAVCCSMACLAWWKRLLKYIIVAHTEKTQHVKARYWKAHVCDKVSLQQNFNSGATQMQSVSNTYQQMSKCHEKNNLSNSENIIPISHTQDHQNIRTFIDHTLPKNWKTNLSTFGTCHRLLHIKGNNGPPTKHKRTKWLHKPTVKPKGNE